VLAGAVATRQSDELVHEPFLPATTPPPPPLPRGHALRRQRSHPICSTARGAPHGEGAAAVVAAGSVGSTGLAEAAPRIRALGAQFSESRRPTATRAGSPLRAQPRTRCQPPRWRCQRAAAARRRRHRRLGSQHRTRAHAPWPRARPRSHDDSEGARAPKLARASSSSASACSALSSAHAFQRSSSQQPPAPQRPHPHSSPPSCACTAPCAAHGVHDNAAGKATIVK